MTALTDIEVAALCLLTFLLGVSAGVGLSTWLFARTLRRIFPLCVRIDQRTTLDVVHHVPDRPPLEGDEWKERGD